MNITILVEAKGWRESKAIADIWNNLGHYEARGLKIVDVFESK